jgi:carotenoid cleavage dioxygenase-like enzyme
MATLVVSISFNFLNQRLESCQPRGLPARKKIISSVKLPTSDEVAAARELLNRSAAAAAGLPQGPMIHESAITGRYMLVLDMPAAFEGAADAGTPLPYCWQPGLPRRVGLLPERQGRQADDIIWSDASAFLCLHAVNAYVDEDGTLVLRFARSKPSLRTGRTVRVAWSAGVSLPHDPADPGPNGSKLLRHDLETGTRSDHDFGAGHCLASSCSFRKHDPCTSPEATPTTAWG